MRRRLAPSAARIAISAGAAGRLGQQQVRQVHARDEQQEADGAQQHPQRAPRGVACHGFAHRGDAGAHATARLGVPVRERLCHPLQVGASGLERHAAFQPSQSEQLPAPTLRIGGSHQGTEDVRPVEEGRAGRQDTDDLMRHAIRA